MPKYLRDNWTSIVIILAVCLVLIMPVIVYQYPYPNHSDDFPRHLEVIERIVNGQGYSDLWQLHNAYVGPAFTGLIIKALHSDPFWTFYVLHYIALIGMAASIWYFSYKVFNKTAANLALPLVVFCTPPFLHYFYNGVIFNMVNLFIFGLMAILALVNWQSSRRPYYALISILLFAIVVLFHSSTGVYLFVGVLVYLVSSIAKNAIMRAWGQVKRLGIYTAVLAAVCGTLGTTLGPEWRGLMIGAAHSVAGASTAPIRSLVSIPDFIIYYSNFVIIGLFILALIYIWRRKIALTAGLGVLLAILGPLALATFVFKTGEPTRAAHDLSMILSLAAAGAIGVAFKKYQLQYKQKHITAVVAVVVIALALPMARFWLDYQSAIRPADQAAIAALEALPGDSYSVSTQIQPSIYSLFVDDKICVQDRGDYIIFRDSPMSGERDPNDVWCKVKGDISQECDYQGLPVVAEFSDGEVRIVIYKGG